ncbi:MAG: PEGA domain-containing protein [candidate division WOR-3 bacterium]|nr:PEGA domain-containing protein [candidate division WOR-3 bacterium]
MKVKLILYVVLGLIIVCFRLGAQDNGFLSVYSEPSGLRIYLDGDFIGTTPIINYPYKPGEYSISIFSSDTIEQKYWRLTSGSLASRLSALWDLSKAGAGTKRVKISSNQNIEIFFSLPKINRTPTKAKLLTTCCLGTGFSFAFLIGYFVANLVSGD